jgi:protein-tyrosine-phosphatase
MLFSFRRRMIEMGATGITFESRGTHASGGSPICALSAELLSEDDRGETFAQSHRSRALTTASLRKASIVFTATRAERSELARRAPEMRNRVFTLAEALQLSSLPDGPALGGTVNPDALQEFADVLHRRRGSMRLKPAHRFLRWGEDDPGETLDLADVHGTKPRAHRAVFKRIDSIAGPLAERTAEYLVDRHEPSRS